MNDDDTCPCLINNAQFKHALTHMGFDIPASDYYAAEEWEREHMKSISGFKQLMEHVYKKSPAIEPRSDMFPTAPRLCKRWWDKELIKGS